MIFVYLYIVLLSQLRGIGVLTLIGGCRERVTSCLGFSGADATERRVQREGHSLVRLQRADSPCRGFGAAS